MRLAISEEEKMIVTEILKKQLPSDVSVWAYGSRLRHDNRPGSDLDLIIIQQQPMTLKTMTELQDAFSESQLHFKVEFEDWHRLTTTFKKIIEQNYVPLL